MSHYPTSLKSRQFYISFVFLLLDPFPGKQKYLDCKTDPSDSTTRDYELEDIITIIMVGWVLSGICGRFSDQQSQICLRCLVIAQLQDCVNATSPPFTRPGPISPVTCLTNSPLSQAPFPPLHTTAAMFFCLAFQPHHCQCCQIQSSSTRVLLCFAAALTATTSRWR